MQCKTTEWMSAVQYNINKNYCTWNVLSCTFRTGHWFWSVSAVDCHMAHSNSHLSNVINFHFFECLPHQTWRGNRSRYSLSRPVSLYTRLLSRRRRTATGVYDRMAGLCLLSQGQGLYSSLRRSLTFCDFHPKGVSVWHAWLRAGACGDWSANRAGRLNRGFSPRCIRND